MGSGWSTSRPGRFNLPKNTPGTHYVWGWVGRRAGVDGYGKSRPHRDSIPGIVQPAASRYTDWAVRALRALAETISSCIDRNMYCTCGLTKVFFHSRAVHLDIIKVLLPTDTQQNYFKRSIEVHIKISPTCFGVITIVRERTIWACYSYDVKTVNQPFKAYRSRDTRTSLTLNKCTLCPHCIYVFCIYLRTNSDMCHLQHKLIGLYNRDEKCLQRGTVWVFK